MAKVYKKYKKFMESISYDNRFKFEEKVIDPILMLIKDNQEYLTEKENIPQLAKIGYIYNLLWYAGRICWGYEGKLLDKNLTKDDNEDDVNNYYQYVSCEDNPKYKIEMCEPINDTIENLIYDAWSVHVFNEGDNISYDNFIKKLKEGRVLSDYEKKSMKLNKTFDEWVEILTDDRNKYKSIYPNWESVADHLLCTTGNGYGWNKDGYIMEQAGGADQDKDIFSNWENADFREDIGKVIFEILSIPEVKLTLDTQKEYLDKYREKRNKEKMKSLQYSIKHLKVKFKDDPVSMSKLNSGDYEQVMDVFNKISTGLKNEEYHEYYPISSSSDIYALCDDETKNRIGQSNFHQSYIDVGKRISQEILTHEKKEKENNIKFAIKYLAYYGDEKYIKMMPESYDKYALKERIEEYFLHLSDNSVKSEIKLDDTANSSYGTNNYKCKFEINDGPKEMSNNIGVFKNTKYYDDILEANSRLGDEEPIKFVSFHYENNIIKIDILVKGEKFAQEQQDFENYLIGRGLEVGINNVSMNLDKLNTKLTCRKPDVMSKSHNMNKSGVDIFSNSTTFYVNRNGRLLNFTIDERKYNTFKLSINTSTSDFSNWVKEEHTRMKLSDDDYGTYDMNLPKDVKSEKRNEDELVNNILSGITGGKQKKKRKLPPNAEGRKGLYAHDFMVWLKENQDNFKK